MVLSWALRIKMAWSKTCDKKDGSKFDCVVEKYKSGRRNTHSARLKHTNTQPCACSSCGLWSCMKRDKGIFDSDSEDDESPVWIPKKKKALSKREQRLESLASLERGKDASPNGDSMKRAATEKTRRIRIRFERQLR